MPLPRLSRLHLVVALIAIVAMAGVFVAVSWFTALGAPIDYDHDGVPRRAWHRWTRARPTIPIVFIAIDTLRADAIGTYGADPSPTPRLDAFAADAAVFENAMTAALWTLPSFTSMFTGLYPPAHGVLTPEHALSEARVTLAEILRGAGYETGAFTGGGFLAKRFGLDQGFEKYSYKSASRTLGESIDGALAWLDARKHAEQPFFLFVHGFDPHRPYRPHVLPAPPDGFEPPPLDSSQTIAAQLADGKTYEDFALGALRVAEVTVDLKLFPDFDKRFWAWVDATYPTRESMHLAWRDEPDYAMQVEWIRRLYAAKVAEADASFGRLLDELARRGVLETSIVIVVGDHGEELMDHAMIGHTRAVSAVCHVPLLVHLPPSLGIAPQRVKKVVRTIDVLPTVLDAVGIALPVLAQGRSLLPRLRGVKLPALPAATFGTRHPENAVRFRGFRLVERAVAADDPIPSLRLFDVHADPHETSSLAGADPETLQRMRSMLAGIEDESLRLATVWASAAGNDSEDATLRELGYLGGD